MGLEGAVIAVTRAPGDSAEFSESVRARGGRTLALPTIRLAARAGAEPALEFLGSAGEHDHDYTIFLSSRAVSVLFESARSAGRESALHAAVSATSVIAVGPKTRAALGRYGIRTAHVPRNHSSVGVGELLSSIRAGDSQRAIIPRSAASNDFLRLLLEKIGIGVTEVRIYDVEPDGRGGDWPEFRRLAGSSGVSAIVFTSASSVRAFAELAGAPPRGALLVAIGPFTSAELARAGLEHITSPVHTLAGSLEALEGAL